MNGALARTTTTAWSGVAAVSAGIFLLVTAELLPIGLLTEIGASLAVSDGMTGLAVSIPGFVAAAAAPLVVLAAGGVDRKRLLIGLAALLALANIGSALAWNLPVLLVSRILVGISIGGFWAVAGSLGTRLAAPAMIGRATACIFGGVAIASVFGVPLGTVLGELFGWRSAFAILAAGSTVLMFALWTSLPRLPVNEHGSFDLLLAQFSNPGLRVGFATTLLAVSGHFAAYTFMRPLFEQQVWLPGQSIGSLLLAYGLAGIAGNFLAGFAAGHAAGCTLFVIPAAMCAAMYATTVAAPISAVAAAIAFALWGLAYGGLAVSLQTWNMKHAPKSAEASTIISVALFNLAIALGSLGGGRLADVFGPTTAVSVGALFVGSTTLIILSARKSPATH